MAFVKSLRSSRRNHWSRRWCWSWRAYAHNRASLYLAPGQEGPYSSEKSLRVVLKDHVPRPGDLHLARLRLGREHLLGSLRAQNVGVGATYDQGGAAEAP